MKIILNRSSAEITVKKSRFIADVSPVVTAQEAYDFLATVKKKYWDARHNCHAFVVGQDGETAHSSDDGEPQGTAGKPILQVLTGSGVSNCIIVVTRYFGGVLLGTGGLVRAYTEAAKAGLDSCTIAEKKAGFLLRVRSDYEMVGKIQYLAASSSLTVTDTSYTDVCETEILVPDSQLREIEAAVREKTAGRASILGENKVTYISTEDGRIRDIRRESAEKQ